MENIVIVLDSREIQLKEQLEKKNIFFTTEQLPVGDIIFKRINVENCEKKDDILLICERKTKSDMLSSIKSGRYSEQRERLKETRKKICYILENYKDSPTPIFAGVNKGKMGTSDITTISGALENLVLYHNIFVIPTVSLENTAKVVVSIRDKLMKKEIVQIGDGLSSEVVKITSQRKDKVLENIFQLQLALIPGVSLQTSAIICEKYPTMKNLVNTYANLMDNVEKENLLSEISLGKKKFGKVLSKRIFEVVCGK